MKHIIYIYIYKLNLNHQYKYIYLYMYSYICVYLYKNVQLLYTNIRRLIFVQDHLYLYKTTYIICIRRLIHVQVCLYIYIYMREKTCSGVYVQIFMFFCDVKRGKKWLGRNGAGKSTSKIVGGEWGWKNQHWSTLVHL